MRTFSKYHGLGNDFLLMEGDAGGLDPEFVRRACDRHRGAGADGMLVLDEDGSDADVRMSVFNADGSRPEMCGNGLRCAARYWAERRDIPETIRIATDAGLRRCRIDERGRKAWQITVEMGPGAWPNRSFRFSVDDDEAKFHEVGFGNPHAVAFRAPRGETIQTFGSAINDGVERFPEGVNVEFAEPTQEERFETVVWERGVGRTAACGTGACAVAVAAWETGRASPAAPVTVQLPGGSLEVRRDDEGIVWLSGPAAAVYSAEWSDDFK